MLLGSGPDIAQSQQRQQGKILQHVETHRNALLHGTYFNLCRIGDDKREEEDASRGSENVGRAPASSCPRMKSGSLRSSLNALVAVMFDASPALMDDWEPHALLQNEVLKVALLLLEVSCFEMAG